MKKKYLFLVIAAFISLANYMDLNAQMASMVRSMMNQFEEIQAKDFDSDDIIPGTVSYPADRVNFDQLLSNAFDTPSNLFSFTNPNGGYIEMDGKEYPTNSIILEFTWLSLPYFQILNGWFEEVNINDMEGKNLMMKEKEIEKYRELGIIQDEFSYPVPGSFSETLWLNRQLKYEEKLSASGKVSLEIPDDYEIHILNSGDTGKEVSLGGTRYQLVAMEKNLVTLKLTGDRRKMDAIETIILNKDNRPFGSMSSVAIDAKYYDMSTHSLKEISDEDLEKDLENINIDLSNTEQVKKIEVHGTIDKLVFFRVNSTKMFETEFNAENPVQF